MWTCLTLGDNKSVLFCYGVPIYSAITDDLPTPSSNNRTIVYRKTGRDLRAVKSYPSWLDDAKTNWFILNRWLNR